MQKTVIINRGIPASGKSSFAKEIVDTLSQKGLSAVRCSTDDFFIVDGEYRFDETKLREYHLKNQNRFKQALKDEIDLVICDNTNIEPWEANTYYELAKENNYCVILMDFEARDLPSHIDAQSNDDYMHNIPSGILENMLNSYQNYKELIDKYSYPKSYHIKQEYNKNSNKVEKTEDISEPFYYDNLIKIVSDYYYKIKDIAGEMILKKMRDYSLDEIKLIPNHYKIIMKEFQKRGTLTAYDIKDILGKSVKQTERDIENLELEFNNIIDVKIGRKKGYKLIDNFDIFIEAFNNNEDLEELFYIAQKSNPELFEKLDFQMSKDSNIFIFKNPIFEKIKDNDIFKELKKAIKSNEYRNIIMEDKELKDIKPIKLIFTDNNWYLAYIDIDDILRLARVSFIKNISYSKKNSYQNGSIEKYLKALKNNFQNSMTLFDKKPQTATIKATPAIAKYFKKDMKKFFSSQKFTKEEVDGSVIFSVEYTQELEVLPFIQKWMPDLIIVEPKELIDAYIEKLQSGINNHKDNSI